MQIVEGKHVPADRAAAGLRRMAQWLARFRRADADALELYLPHRGWLSLRRSAQHTVDVIEGEVWITEDGDPTDYIVCAASRFSSKRSGSLVVHAVRDTRLRVAAPSCR